MILTPNESNNPGVSEREKEAPLRLLFSRSILILNDVRKFTFLRIVFSKTACLRSQESKTESVKFASVKSVSIKVLFLNNVLLKSSC